MKSKRYTKKEQDIIINEIKNYPTNIKHACEKAALMLNRSYGATSFYYYNHLRKDPKVKAITCGSKQGFTQNVKNIMRDEDGNLPSQNLKHYMWLMKELLELDSDDRNRILGFFS